MKFDPQIYPFGRLHPTNSPLDRLFLFWHCYDEEDKLLQDWHDSTHLVPKPTGNILFDSFLNTWGKGEWNEVRNGREQFEKRSYFQTLGVVSHFLIKRIRENVLNDVLVPDGDKFKLPPELKPGVDQKAADRQAQTEIEELKRVFEECEIRSLKKLDKEAKEESHRGDCRDDAYLKALVRMMEIETRCFEIQKHFLAKGEILSESA
jgi:hypothetical protein